MMSLTKVKFNFQKMFLFKSWYLNKKQRLYFVLFPGHNNTAIIRSYEEKYFLNYIIVSFNYGLFWLISARYECGAFDQTAVHVILECSLHRAPSGYHGLMVLNDETRCWFNNIAINIWKGSLITIRNLVLDWNFRNKARPIFSKHRKTLICSISLVRVVNRAGLFGSGSGSGRVRAGFGLDF